MEGNKDDAVKCLKIAKDSIESGDKPRALKFIAKARRLNPSVAVDGLLSSIEKDPSSSSPDQPPTANGHGPTLNNQSKPRQRTPSASSSSPAGAASYTEEQINIVKEIRSKKDYYEILGLEKTCTVEDVRKAYRKLSLKVHPDKNTAPGSDEAFKTVSKAFQCLSNEDSKRKYDVTGSEEPVYERRAARTHGGYNNSYYDDFDADEIFRQFFFGGMGPGATTQFRSFNFGGGMGQRTAQNGSGSGSGSNLRMLLQLLPVILILLLNFMPSSEPIYALSRSYPYEYRFTTQKGANFYVKSTRFEQDYPPGTHERAALEVKVERDYVSALTQNCRHELQRQQWGFVRETPHCEMLKQFQSGAMAA